MLMSVTATKKIESAAIKGDLSPMRYEQLDQIYDKSVTIVDEGYSTRIGDVYRPWNLFNANGTATIKDSVTFANVNSKYGLSSKFIESSWKIHLSIQPDDLGKAWNIIYPILKSHHVPNFKTSRLAVSRILYTRMQEATPVFLEQNKTSVEEKNQSIQDIVRVFNGMQITIYIENGKEREYNDILAEIEPLLYAAGINPGIIDKSDRAIGIYSSIRHVGKGYTSHDKVAGYKAVVERDMFSAIHPKFKAVHFNWNTFDYTRHILKAKLTLEQVLDAKRKYDLAYITKREFIQTCDVASEYFERWHQLIKRTPHRSELSYASEIALTKFKKWINEGHQLIPTLRKDNIKNFKEAEDMLQSSRSNTSFDLPRPRIKRSAAHRNLFSLLPEQHYLIREQSDPEQKEEYTDTTTILKKLSEHRRKTFGNLKSCSLPQIKSQLLSGETNSDAKDSHKLLKEALPEAKISTEQGSSTNARNQDLFHVTSEKLIQGHHSPKVDPGFFEVNFWRFMGGVSGAVIGLIGGSLVSFILSPLSLGLVWLTVPVLGGLIAAGSGYLLGTCLDNTGENKEQTSTNGMGLTQLPDSSDRSPLLSKERTTPHDHSDSLIRGLGSKWNVRMYAPVEKPTDSKLDDSTKEHSVRNIRTL
jgi:hypothetical protein